MTWFEFMALADVVLGVAWASTTMLEREVLLGSVAYEWELPDHRGVGFESGRYGSLLLLAWSLHGWPTSLNCSVALVRLDRCLSVPGTGRVAFQLGTRDAAPPDGSASSTDVHKRVREPFQRTTNQHSKDFSGYSHDFASLLAELNCPFARSRYPFASFRLSGQFPWKLGE